MGKIKFFVITLLSMCSLLTGRIIEAPHFKDILEHVSDETLVILDIDDTLLIPVQTLGTDVWFLYVLECYRNKGFSQEIALEKALADWEGIRHLTQVKIVEEGTDRIIADLQAKKIPVMGFTTQGMALGTRTNQQLDSLNIDLSKTAPYQHELVFENGRLILYRKGILFSSGTNKGNALQAFFKRIDYHPKKIIFINDKYNNLKDLENGTEAMGIEFVGLRYSHEDQRINAFNKDIAEIQWNLSSFSRILSDEEALDILKGQ